MSSRETLSSEVFIQPFYIAVSGLNACREISRPNGEYHTAMKAVIEVIERDFHAGILQALGVHHPVVSQDIILTGQDVSLWLQLQSFIFCKEGDCSYVKQRWYLLDDFSLACGLYYRLVVLFER